MVAPAWAKPQCVAARRQGKGRFGENPFSRPMVIASSAPLEQALRDESGRLPQENRTFVQAAGFIPS